MFKIFILLFIALAALSFIAYQLTSFSLFLNSGRQQEEQDIKSLREHIRDLVDKLVPLTKEELSLLSLNQNNRSVSKRINSITSGTFLSIYNEPLIAYAYKDYVGSDKATLLVQTTKDVWTYSIARGKTKVYFNDQPVGIISGDGTLKGMESKRVLANVEMDHNASSHPLFVGDRQVGHVNNPRIASEGLARAFTIFGNMEKDEKELFLSLSFLSLVEESL